MPAPVPRAVTNLQTATLAGSTEHAGHVPRPFPRDVCLLLFTPLPMPQSRSSRLNADRRTSRPHSGAAPAPAGEAMWPRMSGWVVAALCAALLGCHPAHADSKSAFSHQAHGYLLRGVKMSARQLHLHARATETRAGMVVHAHTARKNALKKFVAGIPSCRRS